MAALCTLTSVLLAASNFVPNPTLALIMCIVAVLCTLYWAISYHRVDLWIIAIVQIALVSTNAFLHLRHVIRAW